MEEENKNHEEEREQKRPMRPRIQRPANTYSTRRYTASEGNETKSTSNYNPSYKRRNDNSEGFRPEGFGTGLQSSGQGQRPQRQGGYRPRYNDNDNSGYQPRFRNEGGAPRPRRNYDNDSEGGYRPRTPYSQNSYGQSRQYSSGYSQNSEGGYNQNRSYRQNRSGYNQNTDGGYSPRPRYGSTYNQGQTRGGYNQNGYTHSKPRNNYDPNAKYSNKKRIEYKEENYDPNEPIRLNKYLANAGVCSRREADDFIRAGVISVNGKVINEVGTKVLRTDEVVFHDTPVKLEKKVYVLLNKPKDYVTTNDDPQQRKTVMDLVKNACRERIYPVGRLDRNTTGVLLLTNDGELASKLTHPKFLKKKVYHVHLDKGITEHDLQQIRDGITLEDGEIKADAVEYADENDKKQVGIEIHSGKNRIVRRIFEALGYRVTKLDRVLFAGLTKKNVRRGDWRYLTEEEVDRLRMGAYE